VVERAKGEERIFCVDDVLVKQQGLVVGFVLGSNGKGDLCSK